MNFGLKPENAFESFYLTQSRRERLKIEKERELVFSDSSCKKLVPSVIVLTWSGGEVRVFKTKWFARYAGREGIGDCNLVEVIREIEKGLVDADYGGGLIKKRIARDGGGKSGGYRSYYCL